MVIVLWFLTFVFLVLIGGLLLVPTTLRARDGRFTNRLVLGLGCIAVGLLGCWSLWIGTLGLVGLLGAYLCTSGMARRAGDAPYCGRCRYNLSGLQGDRCPECGSETTKGNIVFGEWRWQSVRLAVGVAFVLVALVPVGRNSLAFLTNFDWYGAKPAAWVFDDARSPNRTLAMQALNELARRASQLSQPHRDSLVEICLTQQTGLPQDPVLGPFATDLLLRFDEDGILRSEQIERFLKTALQFEMKVRPQIVLNQPFRVALSVRTQAPGLVRFQYSADERLVPSSGGSCSFGARNSAWDAGEMLTLHECGHHALTCTAAINIGRHSVIQESTVQVEVLSEEPPDYIFASCSTPLDGAIADAVRLSAPFVSYGHFGTAIEASVVCAKTPIDLAFELVAASELGPVYFSPLIVRAGETPNSFQIMASVIEPIPKRLRITLKASKEVAKSTIDIEQIWDGQLVFEDVPLLPSGQSSPSGKMYRGELLQRESP